MGILYMFATYSGMSWWGVRLSADCGSKLKPELDCSRVCWSSWLNGTGASRSWSAALVYWGAARITVLDWSFIKFGVDVDRLRSGFMPYAYERVYLSLF